MRGERTAYSELFQNWVVMECDNEVLVYILKCSYHARSWEGYVTLPQGHLSIYKHFVITFHDHPVLGVLQNNSTIDSSPDPLSSREGLASETIVS